MWLNYFWNVKSVCFCVSSAPTFDYGDMPSPLSETESTITVLLRPAQGRGAPVRSGNHLKCTYQILFSTKHGLLKVHPHCVQYVPGGGWRGNRQESEKRAGASGVFPTAHVPRRGPGPRHTALLHSRAATQQPARGQSLHCGWQSHLQRLLEQPFGSTQELSCLLPGYEQLQRGEWL